MKNLQIAIPTYNRNDLLIKLLDSIPSKINVVVSDNGNHVTDSIKEAYNNTRFVSTSKTLDIFSNWNNALKNTNSEWVIIPSDDDTYHRDSLVGIDFFLNKYSEADILIFGHNIIDGKDKIRKGWQVENEIEYKEPSGYEVFKYGVEARMPSIIFKKKLLNKVGFFDENYTLTAADSDLVQRCLLNGRSVFIPKILSNYRVWEGSLTNNRIATKHWLDEIEYWQNKITELGISQYKKHKLNPLNHKRISDIVYAKNLIMGVSKIRKKDGFWATLKFIKSNRYPYKADFKTQIILIKNLLV
jgi:GT2 family glycosyltransferase